MDNQMNELIVPGIQFLLWTIAVLLYGVAQSKRYASPEQSAPVRGLCIAGLGLAGVVLVWNALNGFTLWRVWFGSGIAPLAGPGNVWMMVMFWVPTVLAALMVVVFVFLMNRRKSGIPVYINIPVAVLAAASVAYGVLNFLGSIRQYQDACPNIITWFSIAIEAFYVVVDLVLVAVAVVCLMKGREWLAESNDIIL